MSLAMLSADSLLDCPPRFATERDLSRPTYGGFATEIAAALGTPLMPWQQRVLDVALEVGDDGKLRYRRVLLTVPRQSGKTTLLLVLFVLRALRIGGGGQVMSYAAQTGVDARKKFVDEHVPLLRQSPLEPLFRVRMTNGHEALLWQNGSRHHISAGTEKSGHGATLDLAVVDEAFAQPDGRLEQAFSPAMLTRPEPQLWFVSTAGSPNDVWFRQKVDAGRVAAHEDGVAYFEWSAPEDADPADRGVWRACMPAMGYTVREATIAAEFLSMPLDEFRRAYLNQWVDKAKNQTAIDPGLWSSLVGPTPDRGHDVVFALDVAPDHSTATVAAAWSTPSGSWLQLAASHPGVDWVPDRCAELLGTWGGRLLVEQTGTAAFLLPRLNADPVSRRFYADACSTLDAAVVARTVAHGNQLELNTAVTAARWSSSGEAGQRVLSRKDPRVSPLVAASLALHGLQSRPTAGWVMAL